MVGKKRDEESAQEASAEEMTVEELRQALESARAEAAENWDKYLRAEAELENSRKRLDKFYSERAEEEKRRILARILQIRDDLDRALNHEGPEEGLREGVALIHRQLEKLLQDEGVEIINSLGEPFDPLLHEAVDVVDGDGPVELVVDELQKGYTYRGKLLRPSRVRVGRPSIRE